MVNICLFQESRTPIVSKEMKKMPNLLITGTPGTGKTTLSQRLSEITGIPHLNVGDLVRQKHLHSGKDAKFDAYLMDEDLVCDAMENKMQSPSGCIVDFHSCDFFPERWFDLVVVLQCSTDVLYDRLKKRKYSELKLKENIECEIMQVVLEEAKDSYSADIVVALESNTAEDSNGNLTRITQWINNWRNAPEVSDNSNQMPDSDSDESNRE